jgi:HEAT repeat protein
MHESHFPEEPAWRETLKRISTIRELDDYSTANVDFIAECLESLDDRVRGGAALAAEGCLFERYILDSILQISEYDVSDAVRKAAIQSLEAAVDEGVNQGFEDEEDFDTELKDMEEWDDFQVESLQEDYRRVKNLLLGILQNEDEILEIKEVTLKALSGLGFKSYVQDWIEDFFMSDKKSSRLTAVLAMGKYPGNWERQLSEIISPDTEKSLLMEAISASYSSESELIAKRVEQVLQIADDDPDLIGYALYTLANINRSENLAEILQKYSTHQNERVNKAAKAAIELYTKKSFNNYLEDELGMDDVDV